MSNFTVRVSVISVVDEIRLEEAFSPGAMVTCEVVVKKGLIKKYETSVDDIEKEYLVLKSPVSNNTPVEFEEGQELTLRRKEDKKKQAYVTNVFVIENRAGQVPLLVCSKPREIGKTSLRRYSRFNVELPCSYVTGKISAKGQLNNLSLTGCRLEVSPGPHISKGVLMDLNITLPGEQKISFRAEVVRIYETADEAIIDIALEIREITSEMQDKLRTFLFGQQLM
jgi:c-di-GMP-binding flagellar brake protein YcgR